MTELSGTPGQAFSDPPSRTVAVPVVDPAVGPEADPEVEQLRSQVDTLQRRLDDAAGVRSSRRRRALVATLTVLAVLASTLAILSVWVFRTLTNTDLFVDRVGSVIEQPAVATAVSERAAQQLTQALDLQARIAELLPPELAVAAAPISSAAERSLAQAGARLLQTEQFQQAWDVALAEGHQLSIQVLSGADTTALDTSDGVVTLNLTPVVNILLTEGSEFLSGVLGRDIQAPAVTDDTIDAAVQALESRLGVDLPAQFGQVTLFSSTELATAQSWYQTMRTAVWVAPLLSLALIALAVAASRQRLRTTLVIVVGTTLLLGFAVLALQPVETSLAAAVADVGLRDAVVASFQTVTASLRTGMVVVALLGALAAATLLLTGSGPGARPVRAGLHAASERLRAHPGAALAGGAVVALAVLALVPGRTWGQLGVVGLLYAGLAVVVLAQRRPELATPDVQPPGPAVT
jgi:hypothetical protein